MFGRPEISTLRLLIEIASLLSTGAALSMLVLR